MSVVAARNRAWSASAPFTRVHDDAVDLRHPATPGVGGPAARPTWFVKAQLKMVAKTLTGPSGDDYHLRNHPWAFCQCVLTQSRRLPPNGSTEGEYHCPTVQETPVDRVHREADHPVRTAHAGGDHPGHGERHRVGRTA